MSERITSGSFEFDQNQVVAMREIGQQALGISEDHFCSGFPDFRGGRIRRLGHNNARHNYQVGNHAVLVMAEVGLDSSEQETGRTTGYTHDLVQLKGRGTDERESAEWIEEQIINRGIFPSAVAKLASKAIIGTEPLFDEDGPIHGRVIGQTAQFLDYDSKREELFVKSVASADLGELYTPFGPYASHMLYLQRQGRDISDTPDMGDLINFQGKQTIFLDTYRYPIPEAEGVLATHRRQVQNYANFVYQQLREERLESWEQLIQQDLQFMHNPDAF
ncbi:MAG TPA: hypothetical protein VFT59_04760 [Candidatus Saccharimonadales bacterium]|nr:hypothetical protein [Candidatus Saccharimonadales bacterium]